MKTPVFQTFTSLSYKNQNYVIASDVDKEEQTPHATKLPIRHTAAEHASINLTTIFV